MLKKYRGLVFILIITLLACGMNMIPVFAGNTDDAMADIKTQLDANCLIESHAVADDGYIGIPVDIYVYYSGSYASSGYFGTHVVLYAVNTNTERIGTASDVEIIQSMLDRGYIVAVADYKNNSLAGGNGLGFSLNILRNDLIVKGNYLTDERFAPGTYRKHYIVPSGYNISPELVFWEADKHSASGTLEEIVDIWNSDFKGIKGSSYVKWTYTDENGNTVRKKVTDNAVWYSDTKGTKDQENGEYTLVKYTVAEDITDCVNPDGTPLDLNLYMNVIYPVNPVSSVPVIAQHNSSGSIWDCGSRNDRPHFNGFLFDGYAGVVYDYLYIPMARDNSFGYFDGNDTGYVTGDPISYSADLYSDKLINTAAMRYIRYLSLSEPDIYKFDNESIGVFGVSKGGTHPFLGEAVVQKPLVSEPKGLTTAQLEEKINSKLCSFTPMRILPGKTGASRYQMGEDKISSKGVMIDAGELQPWLTYGGAEIISGAQFIYASCPNNEEDITDGHAPTFMSVQLADTYWSSSYGTASAYINLCREHDIASAWFAVDEGHSNCVGRDVNHGVGTLQAFYDFAGYYLKDDAVKVLYVTPGKNGVDIELTSDITVKFTGPVSENEISAVSVKSSDAAALSGSWSSLFGNTEWTFTPSELMKANDMYTISVPSSLKGSNGKEMGESFSSSFSTVPAIENIGSVTESENGTYITAKVPDLSQANAGDYINSLALDMYVPDDNAANRLDIFAVDSINASEGNFAGSIYLSGKGHYTLDVSQILSDKKAGDEVVFLVKSGKTAEASKIHYTEDFETGIGDSVKGDYAQLETAVFDGKKTVSLKITDDNVQYPNNPYYLTLSPALTNNVLIKGSNITEADYGRKFKVTVRLCDTVSRRISLQMASCDAAKTYRTLDTKRAMKNFTTEAGKWQEFTLDYTVYDSDYGLSGDHRQSLSVLLAPDGADESPIYIDDITVTETITDTRIASASFVAYSDGDYAYKAPAAEEPFALYDAFETHIANYSSWNDVLSAYTYGYTVRLMRDYTYTPEDSFTEFSSLASAYGADGHIFNIDLNGYSVYCEGNSSFINLKTTSAEFDRTKINLYGGNIFLTGAPLVDYSGFAASAAEKTYDINIENLNINVNENFTPYSVISASEIANGCNINTNFTLKNCSCTLKDSALKNWNVTLFGSGKGSLTTNFSIVGGRMKFDSFKKISVYDAVSKTVFLPDASGEYTKLVLPSYISAGETSYATDSGYMSYAESQTDAGWSIHSLKQSELSTVYGIIPEAYADEQKYPFVIFNANGEFQLATDVWGVDGSASVLHTGKGAGDGAVALLRRDYTFDATSGFNNLSQVDGTLNIDLGGHIVTSVSSQNLFNAESKTNYDSTVYVKNGTILTSKASVVRFSSVALDSYKGEKTFNVIFDSVAFGFGENAVVSNLICSAWSSASAKNANANLKLINCKINLSKNTPESAYTIFGANDSSGNVKVTVTVEDGKIVADSLSGVTLINKNASNESSLVMSKAPNGEYTKLYLKDTSVMFKDIISTTDDGSRVYSITENTDSDGYTECVLDGNITVTEYGAINPEYISKKFVAFSGGECIGASDVLYGTTDNERNTTGIMAIAKNYLNSNTPNADGFFPETALSVQILMMADYEMSSGEYYDNLAQVKGRITIDLNGKTLTQYSNSAIFRLHAKSNTFKSEFLLKNGNIVIGNGALLRFGTYTSVNNKKFRMDFEGVNFSLKSGSTTAKPIISYYKQSDISAVFDMTFTDCIFDMTNATKSITLFEANDPVTTYTTPLTYNYTLKGCNIKSELSDNVTVWGTFNKNSSYKYEKSSADGLYLTFTAPLTAEAPSLTVAADGKTYGYVKHSEENGYVTYAPGEITKYGVIPPKYSSSEEYPFVLFHNGVCAYGGATLAGTGGTSSQEQSMLGYAKSISDKSTDEEIVILLRNDYNHRGYRYDNLSQIRSAVVIDLGGYTVTNDSANALFRMQMKNDVSSACDYETHIKMINGTVNLSKSPLVEYSAYGSGFKGGKHMTLTLEDASIKLSDGASAASFTKCFTESSTNRTAPVSFANLNLINCRLDFSNAPDGYNFINAADSSYDIEYPKICLNTKLIGGEINGSANNFNWFVTNPDDKTGSGLEFVKQNEGDYTLLILDKGVKKPSEVFKTTEGEGIYAKISENDDTAVYSLRKEVIFEKTEDGYKFDVAFLYSVSGEFIAAVYDNNGILKSVEKKHITDSDSATITIDANSGSEVKMFLWSSMEAARPVCEAKQIKLQ